MNIGSNINIIDPIYTIKLYFSSKKNFFIIKN